MIGVELMLDSDKPKYLILKETLIDKIKNKQLNTGDKIMSENELSTQYGISRHTVRQALSELVNEGWLYKLQGKGTFVNSSTGEGKDRKTVAIMISYLNDYIFPSIISGMNNVLSQLGINILLFCTDNLYNREKQSLESILSQKIDALIVEPTKGAFANPNLEYYREIQKKGIPILFILASYKELETSYIVQDDELGGITATKHLIKLGHTKIGGIFKSDYQQGVLRHSGFIKAHLEEGLSINEENTVWFENFEELDSPESYVYKAALELIRNCTALVCYNDQIAQKVLEICRNNNIAVPERLSIVSFDDSQMAVASEVKLTTISHPKEKLGEEAARAILDIIDKRADVVVNVMKPELIIRESTKKI